MSFINNRPKRTIRPPLRYSSMTHSTQSNPTTSLGLSPTTGVGTSSASGIGQQENTSANELTMRVDENCSNISNSTFSTSMGTIVENFTTSQPQPLSRLDLSASSCNEDSRIHSEEEVEERENEESANSQVAAAANIISIQRKMIEDLSRRVAELEAPKPETSKPITLPTTVSMGKIEATGSINNPIHIERVQPIHSLCVSMPSLDGLLPTFEGLFSENPETFLTRLEAGLLNYGIPKASWMYLIKPQFFGKAKQWFDCYEFEDFSAFKKSFLAKYDSLDSKLKLQAEFYGKQQDLFERTDLFIQQKIKLQKRLMPLQKPEESMSMIRELFHPRVKVHFPYLPNSIEAFKERGRIVDQSLEMGPVSNDRKLVDKTQRNPPKCRHCPGLFHFYRDCPVLKQKEGKLHMLTSWPITENTLDHINCIVDGKLIPALLDNGAFPNFISSRMVLPSDEVDYKSIEIKLPYGNNSVNGLGKVHKFVEIGSTKYYLEFVVIKNLTESIILGKPFLKNEGCIIDFKQSNLILGNFGRETIPFLGHLLPQTPVEELDWSLVNHEVPEENIEQFRKVIRKYNKILSPNSPLGHTDAITHKITLKNNKIISVPPYKVSDLKKKIINEQVKEMRDSGIIVESTSPYSSPIHVVDPHGKKPRFCLDFRKINEITEDEEVQRLNITDLLNNIGENKIFTSLDLRKGYWQILLDKDAQKYTAFTTPDKKRYMFRVMPFGLKAASGTFMRLMSKVLDGYIGKICEVFIDDILIYSKNYTEHIHHLELVLERLALYNLTVSLEKCEFGKSELIYLGHSIIGDTHTAQQAHVEAITNFPEPRTRKQLLSFIGTCNWIRPYVENAADILAPLTAILSRKPFKWTPADTRILDGVKKSFQNIKQLHRPQKNLGMILQTDASDTGISGTLYQEENGERFIIANASSKLSAAERNYHINEKECLAIVWAIKKFYPYLDDRKFLLRTDSRAVTWLSKFKESRSKLMRWSLLLQGLEFDIEHVPGTKNELPDAMSRSPCEYDIGADVEDWYEMVPPPFPYNDYQKETEACLNQIEQDSSSSLVKAQSEDKLCNKIIASLRASSGKPIDSIGPKEAELLSKYKIEKDLLLLKSNKDGTYKILVPKSMSSKILEDHHSSYIHPGRDQMIKLIQQQYAWKGMNKQIASFVQKCQTCAQVKSAGRTNQASLTPRVASNPLSMVSVDLMGPYPRSKRGKNYLLVITDVFSKWTQAYPLSNPDSKKVIQALELDFFAKFGYPEVIISDNGPQFISKQWKEKLKEWNILPYTTAIYSAHQNPVERKNQQIKMKLKALLVDKVNHKSWDENIHRVIFSINTTVNAATQLSPAQILFGRNLRHPNDPIPKEWVENAVDLARQNQAKYHSKRNQQDYQPARELVEGQRVLIRNHSLSNAINGFAASLSPTWIGPFIIKKQLHQNVYLCENEKNPKDVKKIELSQIQIL